MARVAQPLLFRAETTLLPWGAIAGRLVREFVRRQLADEDGVHQRHANNAKPRERNRPGEA